MSHFTTLQTQIRDLDACSLGTFYFILPLFPHNPHFPALRSSHGLPQRPSPQKRFLWQSSFMVFRQEQDEMDPLRSFGDVEPSGNFSRLFPK
jgi:hypothetical protein